MARRRALILLLCMICLRPAEAASESLIDAIKNGHEAEAARLIASGADLSQVDEDGNTILIIAVTRSSNLVQALLDQGADPGATNAQGFNVLHCLAGQMYIPDHPRYVHYRENFYKYARLVLEKGVDG